MLMTLLKWIASSAFLASLFWCSARDCMLLLLAFWTIAIAVFVYSNLKERFLGIPVSLAAAGVLGSIFVLAIPGNTTLTINVAILITFLASVEVLKEKRHPSIAVRHRAW